MRVTKEAYRVVFFAILAHDAMAHKMIAEAEVVIK